METKINLLAIESSCDDTAVAVLENDTLLANIICTQKVHEEYGGVVPELASRAHQKNIVPVVSEALKKAGLKKEQLSAIAYTEGPGLLGSLLVGASFAKSLALSLNIPLIGVNHIQGHILCQFIKDETPIPKFPFLSIILSGGHTQIFKVSSHFELELLGTTLDDAIGEAYDKCGKIMGLDYPSGPLIDKLAQKGNPLAFDFPIPKVSKFDVSYSGVKTAFMNFINKKTQQNDSFIEENIHDLCASIQYVLNKIILQKIEKISKATQIKSIALGGGVSANSDLRKQLTELATRNNCNVYLPPMSLTTDNAAMIGIVGYLKYKARKFDSITNPTQARFSL